MAKILVADDNSNIQKMVGLALKDQGIDVVAVGNGEAAVRKISDIRPDLVLADVFMPVRNGYEVCKYVKEDPSLAHIPVILLVGAFDPLDEQEAQRVGADGVLKKPFVPPDPLISMVKSALARAGVSIGPNSGAEKIAPPSAPRRSTADILGGVSPKLPVFTPENLPEIAPDPLEEFAPGTPHLKIAAGSEPLAFGSLLDTNDAEDLAITAKPMIEIAKERKWDEESDEVEEEKEEPEERNSGGWRPGLDETLSQVPEAPEAAPDWRDQAFHGSSPASSFPPPQWTSAETQPSFAEAAESQAVAVATVEHQAVAQTAPFAGDAWAAAMAAGAEDKVEAIREVANGASGVEATPQVPEQAVEPSYQAATPVQDAAPAELPSPVIESASQEPLAEPANWAPAPQTAWESEAKKASLLASTWDAPKPICIEETQEIPPYAPEPQVEHIEARVEDVAEQSVYSAEPVIQHEPESEEKTEIPLAQVEEPAARESSEERSVQSHWEAPAAEPAAVVEEVAAAKEPVTQAPPSEPDMDELVARVLGKMNPEVLQRVTREILKPVIEAIVRDEISSKKS